MLGMDESKGVVHDLAVNDEGRRENLSENSDESCSGEVLNSPEKDSSGFVSSVDSVNSETGDGKLIHKAVNLFTTYRNSNSEDAHNDDELRSTDIVIDIKILSEQGSGEPSSPVVQPREHSSNCVGGLVPETVIVVNPENVSGRGRSGEPVFNDKGLESVKVAPDELKTKVAKGEKQTCAVEKKFGAGGLSIKENWDGEVVCRICYLSSEVAVETSADTTSNTTSAASMDLIQLGCGCKDELGIAHSHCAEAWFKLKGNRICEICGEIAANVTGVGDHRFMGEWNGRRSIGHNGSLSERSVSCWRGQPFCNFLMACLVIAFVLPWFFRVNMF